jgi:MFS family permease
MKSGWKRDSSPFHWLVLASGAGNMADGISLAFLPMVAVSLSKGAAEVSWIEGARQLPLLFLALQAGILLDRMNRRLCVFYINLIRGFLLFALGLALKWDLLNYGSLFLFALMIGATEAINDVAMPSILPEIAKKEDLAKNNGLLSATETTTNYFLGRSIGSAVSSIYSSTMAASVAGGLYFCASLFMRPLTKISVPQSLSNQNRTILGELKEGLAYVWHEKNLRYLALMGALGNAAFGAVLGTLILYSTEILKAPEWSFGLLQSAFAIGTIILGFRVGPIIQKLGDGRALTWAVGTIPVCFLITPLVPYVAMLIFTSLVDGGAAVIWNTVSISYRQRTTPSHLLGRATAVFRMVSYGSMPLGSFLGGPLAQIWGLRMPYFVAAMVAGINVIIALRVEKKLNSLV